MAHVTDGCALADELHARMAEEVRHLRSADALATLGKVNADPRVTGILVLRRLPSQVPDVELYRLLDPAKHIEAVTTVNAGLLPPPSTTARTSCSSVVRTTSASRPCGSGSSATPP